MKKVMLVAILLLASNVLAQQEEKQQPTAPSFQSNIAERTFAPTYSDLYCSGFITNENINASNNIAGGVNSPNDTFYGTGGKIFLQGSGYQEGMKFSVVRALKDPNQYEVFKGQKGALASVGQPYADIGRVRVVAIRGSMAVAEVEFACQNVTIGDLVIPFKERPNVAFGKIPPIQQFPSGPGRVNARIVMGREFDTELGTGQKVYLNAGTDKGVKVGDYFRAVRSYDSKDLDPADAAAYGAPVGEDNQKVPGKVDKKLAMNFPYHAVGQMIVLNVTPTSSTAMITDMLDTILVGDKVEMENEK